MPSPLRFSEARILVFDTETTGTDVYDDRIVELGAAYFEGGRRTGLRRALVNPGRPIPPEATAVHGIRDADVADQPGFDVVGARFAAHLDGSALDGRPPMLCGYNAVEFDTPLLNAELDRAGLAARVDPTRVVDPVVFVRWHHRALRQRTLVRACARHGVRLDNAHSAAADAAAAGELLLCMVRAGLIPDGVEAALAEQARLAQSLEQEWARWSYWLYADRATGALTLGAGKHCGLPLDRVDPDYLDFLLARIENLPAEVRARFGARVRVSA